MNIQSSLFTVACALSAGVLMPNRASADPITTPVGVFDSSCIHAVPMGAKVDPERGDVSVNGIVVAHYDTCLAPSTPSIPRDRLTPPGSGGWYEQVAAFATSFDGLYVNFQVPSNPSGGLQYFWPGFENWDSTYTNVVSVIQPVLQWGYNGTFGGNYYTLSSWGVVMGGHAFYSPVCYVNQGDQLKGSTWMESSDEWRIQSNDYTNGCVTYLEWYPAPSWPPYNYALMGVFEAYSLTSCNQLSPQNGVEFILQAAYEADPYWNSYNDVTNSLTWSQGADGLTPNCSWALWEGLFNGRITSFLDWTH